jgi:glycosyltransferase involved in cell wall biosynthesis
MFSVIIATRDSERALVQTLAALVPGATAGVVREVIVTDGGSRDATAEVADIAGCRFISSPEPLGTRLKSAAMGARGSWLMFLRPGVVPGVSWIDDVIRFVEETERSEQQRAAAFDNGTHSFRALVRKALGFLPGADQGLIISKSFYAELGGHSTRAADPEAEVLRRIGRRRIVVLRAAGQRARYLTTSST